jgi:hypothetical protein
MTVDSTLLAGYWRWVSMRIEFTDGGPGVDLYGSSPEGGVIFTPQGRIMALIANPGRYPACSDDDRLALFRSFAAYTGRFQLEAGNRFVTEVDATWDPAWAGRQERFFSIDGDTFTVRTAPQTHPSSPGRELVMIGVARRADV